MNNKPTITKKQLPKGVGFWKDGIRRLARRRIAMVCLFIIFAYFAIAAFVYLAEAFNWQLSIVDWSSQVGAEYQPPSRENIFGTDFLGRSVLRKTIYGTKISMTVAFWASVISILIGVPLGAIAGYFRGWVDELIVWLYTTLSSIPYILLILAFALVLKDKSINLSRLHLGTLQLSGITSVYLAMGLTSWVGICRLIRGEIIKHKESEYVLAARSYGCKNTRIIFRHLLPNVFHLIIINFSLRFVSFIQAEVILSFSVWAQKTSPAGAQ